MSEPTAPVPVPAAPAAAAPASLPSGLGPGTTPPKLELQNLYISYTDRQGKTVQAVEDVNLTIANKPGVAGQLDLSDTRAACHAWSRAATALERALATTLNAPDSPARTAHLAEMNERIRSVEQTLLNADGIPGRPWFRHVLYAPRETYAAMTLPGVQEAIEAGDWNRARTQLALVTERISAAAAATKLASER